MLGDRPQLTPLVATVACWGGPFARFLPTAASRPRRLLALTGPLATNPQERHDEAARAARNCLHRISVWPSVTLHFLARRFTHATELSVDRPGLLAK